MTKMTDYEKDPRSDLAGDHVLWVALLTTARERGEELFGILHCLRCGGAHLERDKDFGMLIRPGEWDKTEYEVFRSKHLAPRKAEVVEALRLAAKRLPQVQKDTLKTRVAARVKAIEPKALALGWTKDEIWSEKEWTDPTYGHRRQSIYLALLSGSQTWGHCDVAEITAEKVMFEVPGPGLSSPPVRMAMYKVRPEFVWPLIAEEPHASALPKKAEVLA